MSKIQVFNNRSVADKSNKDYLAHMMNKKIIAVENAGGITPLNISAPLGALQFLKPQAVQVLTAPRTADEVSTPEQNGRFGDKAVTIKLREFLGRTSIDDGSAGDGINSSTNYTFATRGAYYFRADWMVRDIDETQAGNFGESLRADNINSAMEALAIERNRIFFEGVEAKTGELPVYGLLNAPELDNWRSLPKGKSGATYWDTKEPEEIFNDVVTIIAMLNKKSKGLVSQGLAQGGRLKLLISSVAYAYLAKSNAYGLNALALLQNTYKNLDIVQVPQMERAYNKQDALYMIFTGMSQPTIINSYVEMARFYPVFTRASETSQKISAASSGCIIQYPLFVERFGGVLKHD